MGAPVLTYTATGPTMVKPICAHLDDVQSRSALVESRVEQHFERLGHRPREPGLLAASVSGNLTRGSGRHEKARRVAGLHLRTAKTDPMPGDMMDYSVTEARNPR